MGIGRITLQTTPRHRKIEGNFGSHTFQEKLIGKLKGAAAWGCWVLVAIIVAIATRGVAATIPELGTSTMGSVHGVVAHGNNGVVTGGVDGGIVIHFGCFICRKGWMKNIVLWSSRMPCTSILPCFGQLLPTLKKPTQNTIKYKST